MKTALTIAGSDSCGGAGIQADLKTFTVLGVYGMSAITAITAQNTLGVKEALELSADLVRKQIDVVASDIAPDATKTGMLGSAALIGAVADAIVRNHLQPYVCDPVMISKSGDRLLSDESLGILTKKLFPLATVITPNLREASALIGGQRIEPTVAVAKEAARRIADLGAKGVILKGLSHADSTIDLFFDGREFLEFAAPTQPKDKTHGSGCAFSAAITAGLASGKSLVDSIDQAKQLVNMAIQYGDGQGRGGGAGGATPVNVLAFAAKKK